MTLLEVSCFLRRKQAVLNLNCAVFDTQLVTDFGANRCQIILAMHLKAVPNKEHKTDAEGNLIEGA